MKLYLAHPLADRLFHRLWETGFEERTGIDLINPFYEVHRDDIAALDAGGMKMSTPFTKIVLDDLAAIQSTEGIVAVVNKHSSIGTIMEICYTKVMYNMPVYVICTDGRHNHPWLKYHATKIFKSHVQFEQWITEEDSNVTTV